MKTRKIKVTRKIRTINENGKETLEFRTFPCSINAAVPFDHKMIKYERSL